MKRFWLVMLSLGLVLAFSASALAVDVKFSGSFYAAGMYLDKTTLMNTSAASGSDNVSTAFYYQRLRVQTDFIVSPGLKLVTRFDAMERAWGAPRSATNVMAGSAIALDSYSQGTAAENENIAFDIAYISYTSPIGIFDVGIMTDGAWGTVFGDDDSQLGKVAFTTKAGPVIVSAYIGKSMDFSKTAKLDANTTDQDFDKYNVVGIYPINKDIQVGLLYQYQRIAITKDGTLRPSPYFFPGKVFGSAHAFSPYAKAKIGPVAVEAELTYAFGKLAWEGDGASASKEVSISNITAYVNAGVDVGMFYGGGTFAYISGDDPTTGDKNEGGFISGGTSFNPALIMFNYERTYWAGPLKGYGYSSNSATGTTGAYNSAPMTNAWFGQGKVGIRPIPALDVNLAVSYAQADKKPAGFLNNVYGWEVDVTGTYKITNNLSYMLGVGYLFTGDYYKYSSNDNAVRDNYLVINKLTLTF